MINKRKIGKLDLEITEIGMGTAPLGGWPEAVHEKDASDTLETAWEQGIRYFDTAPLYGSGMAEIRVGNFLENKNRDDFIISTGITHSVRDLCKVVFSKLQMNYKDYVVQNTKYMRPEELKYLKGDSVKARNELGWKPEYAFESMIDEMIDHFMVFVIYSRKFFYLSI